MRGDRTLSEQTPAAPPTLDYRPPAASPPAGYSTVARLVLGTAAAVGLVALAASLMPSTRVINCGNDGKCRSNLHQIGLAILLYQQDNGGQYPDTLGRLIENTCIGPEVFVCPSADEVKSPVPTTGPVDGDAMLSPGHVSYAYLGRGLTAATVPPNAVVAYERHAVHGLGYNVLFGDGHTEYVEGRRAAGLIAGGAARLASASGGSPGVPPLAEARRAARGLTVQVPPGSGVCPSGAR